MESVRNADSGFFCGFRPHRLFYFGGFAYRRDFSDILCERKPRGTGNDDCVRYYGEMITYLGMSAPMAVLALISWLKNPYRGDKSQVKVNKISRRETVFMLVLSAMVTAVFWFILKKLGTANLVPSTVSVTTSFIAVYLTFRRSAYYALGYALNDLILIVLWIMAATEDINYISMVICFLVFLANDVYGFFSWLKMQKRQAAESEQQVSE